MEVDCITESKRDLGNSMWARVHNRCRKGKTRMYCLTFLIWWLWRLEEHKDLEKGLWINQADVQHVILPEEILSEKSSYSWSMYIIMALKLSIGFLYNEQCFTLCFLVSIPKCHSHVCSDVEQCWSSQIWKNLKKNQINFDTWCCDCIEELPRLCSQLWFWPSLPSSGWAVSN